jgi:hypothetical protein
MQFEFLASNRLAGFCIPSRLAPSESARILIAQGLFSACAGEGRQTEDPLEAFNAERHTNRIIQGAEVWNQWTGGLSLCILADCWG